MRNAYIDFSKMTLGVVAVVTDVIRERATHGLIFVGWIPR
jgi:hypothetical protein